MSPSTNVVRFNAIHFIESLPKGEYRTGYRTYEDVEPLGLVSTPIVHAEYHPVQTRNEFFDVLRAIANDARDRRRSPVLHIDAHGGAEGIQTASGELIRWADMKADLALINQVGNFNLLVILAACEGAHLVKALTPTDRAAFLGLIGPNRVVKASELEVGGIEFYRTLFREGDAAASWRAMNAAVDPNAQTFGVFTADNTFRLIMREYFRTLCTDEALALREQRLVEMIERDGGTNGRPIDGKLLAAQLRDLEGQFRAFRDYHFFCDLFPGNAQRFGVTFDSCINGSE